MRNLFLLVTVIAAIGGVATNRAGACASRLPTFELAGFPISRHQVAVLGSAQVVESTATPTLMLDGMPASPHQIAVLTPRAKRPKIAEASVDPSQLAVGLIRSSSQGSTRQASCASE